MVSATLNMPVLLRYSFVSISTFERSCERDLLLGVRERRTGAGDLLRERVRDGILLQRQGTANIMHLILFLEIDIPLTVWGVKDSSRIKYSFDFKTQNIWEILLFCF